MTALRSVLGSKWVIRPQGENDYGIDAEIEIFESGATTGRIFKVQLKGSDSRRTKRTARVRIETFTYWLSFDVPVLIVYYEARTDRLFAIWAQSYELRPNASQPSKSTILHFPDESHLDPAQARATLNAGLERIRELREGLTFPLSYNVTYEDIPIQDQTKLSLALRVLTDRTNGNLARVVHDPSLTIRITSKEVRIAAQQNLASMTAHLEDYGVSDVHPEELAADVLAACALFLVRFGRSSDAAILFEFASEMSSSFLRSYEAAIYASVCLESERKYHEAYRIGRRLFLNPNPTVRNAGSVYISVAVLNLPARELHWPMTC